MGVGSDPRVGDNAPIDKSGQRVLGSAAKITVRMPAPPEVPAPALAVAER